MKTMEALLVSALLAAAPGASAPAAESNASAASTQSLVEERVRLTLTEEPGGEAEAPDRIRGTVVRAEEGQLWVKTADAEAAVVAMNRVERLEVSRGRHSRKRGAKVGAAYGALAGLAVAGIAYAMTEPDDTYGFGNGFRKASAIWTAMALTPVTAVVGAGIGAAAPPASGGRACRTSASGSS